MPYKYVVSVDSKSFNEAPDEILRALGRLSWATEKAVPPDECFHPPNELLALGYFEDMKIGASLNLSVSLAWKYGPADVSGS